MNATRALSAFHESGPVMVSASPLVTRATALVATITVHRCTGRAVRSKTRSSSRRSSVAVSSALRGSVRVKAMVALPGDHAYWFTSSGTSVSGQASPPSVRISQICATGSLPARWPRADTKLMCRPSGDHAGSESPFSP